VFDAKGAEHDEFDPPLAPSQDHVNGPLPATDEAPPDEHSFELGADVDAIPLADPHAPFTTEVLSGAEQLAFDPPLLPEQVQAKGPDPATEEAVPVEHRFVEGELLTLKPLAFPQEPLTILALSVNVTLQLAEIVPVV
jgi:hypothetical protein